MEKSPPNFDDNDKKGENGTPTKHKSGIQSDSVTPITALDNLDTLKPQEKSPEQKVQKIKTPEKTLDVESELRTDFIDNDDGMLSTVEQARLLIAACRSPSKTVNKTPVKRSNLGGKRSIESSPGTPGKQRRVELVTLSSPKTKRFKQEQST